LDELRQKDYEDQRQDKLGKQGSKQAGKGAKVDEKQLAVIKGEW
jgi:hypothetical protein